MSSLYGAGGAHEQNIADTTNTEPIAIQEQAYSTSEIGKYLDRKAVEAYVRMAYADEPILVDVARCESTFRQFDENGRVIRGKVNSDDLGVMQINEYYHGERAEKLGYDLHTLEGNVAFGRFLFEKYGTDPWVSSSKCWGAGQALARR